MTARFTLTDHAAQALAERRIDLAWVESAIERPARTEPDGVDPDLLHRLIRVPEFGNRVLRVVATRDEPFRVITAFFDRRLQDSLF